MGTVKGCVRRTLVVTLGAACLASGCGGTSGALPFKPAKTRYAVAQVTEGKALRQLRFQLNGDQLTTTCISMARFRWFCFSAYVGRSNGVAFLGGGPGLITDVRYDPQKRNFVFTPSKGGPGIVASVPAHSLAPIVRADGTRTSAPDAPIPAGLAIPKAAQQESTSDIETVRLLPVDPGSL